MKYLASFIMLLLLWLILANPDSAWEWLTGAAVALLLSVVLGRLYRPVPIAILDPVRWLWFVVYALYFIYYCIRANLDVAYRALHPDMPIRPGIVKVQTRLKSDIAKTFLANSITLTPGTLTIDIMGNSLFIHWINIVTDDPDGQTDIIVRRFETLLERIFE